MPTFVPPTLPTVYTIAIDENGNVISGGSVSAAAGSFVDGSSVTEGYTTDAAYSGAGAGTEISILKKLVEQLAAALSVTVSNFPATQPISGTVGINNFPASTPVSGTFWQATQPVSGTFWQATQPVSGTVTMSNPVNTVGVNNFPASQIVNDSAVAGTIGYTSGGTGNTTANIAWTVTFASKVNHVLLQNNSGANINWATDAAATAGSPVLAFANPGNALLLPISCTTLSILTTVATAINGTVGANIVALGWA